MIVPTSVAVSAFGAAGAVPPTKGKKRGLTSPAMPPTTCGTNSESGGGPAKIVAPAILATVVGAGGFVTFEKGSLMPSARIVSPRIPVGASKPRMPEAAMSSSTG